MRSYVLKDGDLFLSLMADGGIYELKPVSNYGATPAPPGSAQTGPVIYTCANARGEREEISATFRQTDTPSVLVKRGDRTIVASRVPSGSGARYEGPDLMFWEHQGEAMVTWMNVELTCKPSKSAGHIGRT